MDNEVIKQDNKVDLNGESPKPVRDKRGRFIKGNCANPQGRAAGLRDKANEIKEILYKSFHKIGGMVEFIRWANLSSANKREFYRILFGTMPKELDIKGDGLTDTQIILVTPNKQKVSNEISTKRGVLDSAEVKQDAPTEL